MFHIRQDVYGDSGFFISIQNNEKNMHFKTKGLAKTLCKC